MKTFISLLLASVIVGFGCFAIFYWLVNFSFKDAVNMGISGGIAGLGAAYWKIYLERKQKRRISKQGMN